MWSRSPPRKFPTLLAAATHRFWHDAAIPTIPIVEENDLEKVIKREGVDVVVFSYSDVAHPTVMHLASRSVAAVADFWLLGVTRTQVSRRPRAHGNPRSHRGKARRTICRTWQILSRAVAHDPQFCREGSSRPRLVDWHRTAERSAPVLRSPERTGNPLQRNSRAGHPHRSAPGNHGGRDRLGLRPHPQGPDLIREGKIVFAWPTFGPVLASGSTFHPITPRSRKKTSPRNPSPNRLQSTHFCFRLPATFRERAPSRRTPCSLGRKETKSRDHR